MASKTQSGFSAVIGIFAIVIVIGIIGFIGWRLYNHPSKPANNNISANQSTSKQPLQKTTATQNISNYVDLALANDTVHFQVPKSWIVSKDTGIIRPSLTLQAASCMDEAGLMPPDKPATIYGNGTEFFTVNLYACPLQSNQSIQQWFENDYGAGVPSGSDQYSTASINGYDTYYFKQINNSYNEINYAFGAFGKAVLLTARVWEVHYNPDDSNKIDATMDVTRYIPDIQSIAKSIVITK